MITSDRPLVLFFADIGADDIPAVGGKGANLGELARAGLPVPPGFCVTTAAFRLARAGEMRFAALIAEIEAIQPADLEAARRVGDALRRHIVGQPLPDVVRRAVVAAWERLGRDHAYAVRSSATAEDLPHASFAGQQDTYLNVVGEDALLNRVRDCWASLYTDRAILYRIEQGISHAEVSLSVVVQQMVHADKAGILFTAHPLTGHRHVATIDAGWGLGESLVSGRVSADYYEVDRRTGRVQDVRVGDKALAIRSVAGGGTREEALAAGERDARVLDDDEIAHLLAAADRVEALRKSPQDIEWCIAGGELYLVQARPITSLYPLPEPAPTDDSLHVHFCLNHFQVMTDAMPPLALHTWQLMLPFGKSPDQSDLVIESPLARVAGGRLFVDTSSMLRLASIRNAILSLLGAVDRLARDALAAVTARPEFQPGPRVRRWPIVRFLVPRAAAALDWLLLRDLDGAAGRTAAWCDRMVAEASRDILAEGSLVQRLESARRILATLIWPALSIPPMIVAGVVAGRLVHRLTDCSQGELQALGRGLAGNVTTDMDLAVGDLADLARAHPEVRARLVAGERRVDAIRSVRGGEAFAAALAAFVDRYGARGPSEIDISRPRFRDAPESLLAAIAGNLHTSESGAHRRHHRELAAAAEATADELRSRAGRGVFGWLRRRLVDRFIRVHRNLLAVREHPKFLLIRILDAARSTALEAGRSLVARGQLDAADDVFLLDWNELVHVLEDPAASVRPAIASRRSDLARYRSSYPPRVLTSDGESPRVEHARDHLPDGALAGSPASGGVAEGRARVITDPARETLDKGEILVAPFTDPGWTPLFINAAGLVMEVGGLMTHGSVVAREYGIPAVVCVPDATHRIRTGQRIRVHGDDGYVEILDTEPESGSASESESKSESASASESESESASASASGDVRAARGERAS